MEWAIGLIVVGGAAVAIVLWAMAGGDKRLSQLSISQPRLPSTQIPPQGTRYGYSVWAWKGGAWTMVENKSAAGAKAGPAPRAPGKFDGEHVKVPSVPG